MQLKHIIALAMLFCIIFWMYKAFKRDRQIELEDQRKRDRDRELISRYRLKEPDGSVLKNYILLRLLQSEEWWDFSELRKSFKEINEIWLKKAILDLWQEDLILRRRGLVAGDQFRINLAGAQAVSQFASTLLNDQREQVLSRIFPQAS